MNSEKLNTAYEIDLIQQIPVVNTILDVICQTTGMGFAAVARVTKDQWLATAVKDDIQFGLVPGGELVLETTICHEIENSHEAVIIDHVSEDSRFAHHHTPAMYGFQSYISIPIILKDGSFYGTLCAIDPQPAKLNSTKVIGMFTLFADLIAVHLNMMNQLAVSETQLTEEKRTSELRDQFIAILGHDLRNPLGAILNSSQLLMRMPLDDRAKRLATIVQDSSYRALGLIENVLDFARGQLGDGIILNREITTDIGKILMEVITELRVIWPERTIITQFELNHAINCDGKRIAQLFSNLLGNALTHGKADKPVRVEATANSNEFRLSIYNAALKITDETIQRLFLPFSHGNSQRDKQGLGLGLYISSEIARAHGASLTVCSTDEQTCFTFLLKQS